jgi:hypothetical protein
MTQLRNQKKRRFNILFIKKNLKKKKSEISKLKH